MFSGYCLAAMSQFKGKKLHEKRCLSRLQISVILLIITNIPMAFYMSLFHQVSFLFANIVLASCRSMDFFFFLLLHYFHLCLISYTHCGREEQKMLCIICQKKPMMEEWRVSSSSCLVIQHLTTLPYITTYLCAFWTALLGGYFLCTLKCNRSNLSYFEMQ